MWLLIPRPLTFLLATLKSWAWYTRLYIGCKIMHIIILLSRVDHWYLCATLYIQVYHRTHWQFNFTTVTGSEPAFFMWYGDDLVSMLVWREWVWEPSHVKCWSLSIYGIINTQKSTTFMTCNHIAPSSYNRAVFKKQTGQSSKIGCRAQRKLHEYPIADWSFRRMLRKNLETRCIHAHV